MNHQDSANQLANAIELITIDYHSQVNPYHLEDKIKNIISLIVTNQSLSSASLSLHNLALLIKILGNFPDIPKMRQACSRIVEYILEKNMLSQSTIQESVWLIDGLKKILTLELITEFSVIAKMVNQMAINIKQFQVDFSELKSQDFSNLVNSFSKATIVELRDHFPEVPGALTRLAEYLNQPKVKFHPFNAQDLASLVNDLSKMVDNRNCQDCFRAISKIARHIYFSNKSARRRFNKFECDQLRSGFLMVSKCNPSEAEICKQAYHALGDNTSRLIHGTATFNRSINNGLQLGVRSNKNSHHGTIYPRLGPQRNCK